MSKETLSGASPCSGEEPEPETEVWRAQRRHHIKGHMDTKAKAAGPKVKDTKLSSSGSGCVSADESS
jgi:hypothetical protein